MPFVILAYNNSFLLLTSPSFASYLHVHAAQLPALEGPEEPETLPDDLCPAGLDQDWWSKLVQYRARKVG